MRSITNLVTKLEDSTVRKGCYILCFIAYYIEIKHL